MYEDAQRAQIKEYVHKAFLAKIMQMNDICQNRKSELRGELGLRGHSMNSSAWMIGEMKIEEERIADLLRQKADLYIDAYGRVGLRIGPDVLRDLAHSQVELAAARKGSLIGSAQLTEVRTNRSQSTLIYGHLGKKASVAMKEIEASIDLYNLSHSANAAKRIGATEKDKKSLIQEKLPAPPVASEQPCGHDDNQRQGGELEKPNSPTTTDSSLQETIWAKMWSWVVVGTIDLFILSGGIAFMTSRYARTADVFLGVGTALFLVKFWTWEEAKRQPTVKKWTLQATVTLIFLGLVLIAVSWNHTINRVAPDRMSGQPTVEKPAATVNPKTPSFSMTNSSPPGQNELRRKPDPCKDLPFNQQPISCLDRGDK